MNHDIARWRNPWTIEIQSTDGHWQEFCHDAPITLGEAEQREKQMKEENPQAVFRVIPWLNSSQHEFVRARVSELEASLAEAQRHQKETDQRVINQREEINRRTTQMESQDKRLDVYYRQSGDKDQRIAELEADKRRLVEALKNLRLCDRRVLPTPYGHDCRWCGECCKRAAMEADAAMEDKP